jgi:hypothetical protein
MIDAASARMAQNVVRTAEAIGGGQEGGRADGRTGRDKPVVA